MEKSVSRKCIACANEIVECMGFVKAGDVLLGKDIARELCGRCVLVWQWTSEGELVSQEAITS